MKNRDPAATNRDNRLNWQMRQVHSLVAAHPKMTHWELKQIAKGTQAEFGAGMQAVFRLLEVQGYIQSERIFPDAFGNYDVHWVSVLPVPEYARDY